MSRCPHCGHENPPEVRICAHCKKPLATQVDDWKSEIAPQLEALAQAQRKKPLSPTGMLEPRHLPFAALPQGSLVEQYIVLDVLRSGSQFNDYLAEPFDDTDLVKKHWLLREAADIQTIRGELALIDRGLAHPAVRVAIRTFVEEDYNRIQRHYLVLPGHTLTLLEEVDLPLEFDQALQWIGQLADGLAYLHSQQVALGEVSPQHVCIAQNAPQWFDLGAARCPADQTAIQADLKGLGHLFAYMLTAQKEPNASNNLRPDVQTLVQQTKAGAYTNVGQFKAALGLLTVQAQQPADIDLRLGRRTDVGATRQLNEDSLLTLELGQFGQSLAAPLGIYAVADGMGGHAAGEIASSMVIESLARRAAAELLMSWIARAPISPEGITQWMRKATQVANEQVYQKRQESGGDMGSTLVWAVVTPQTIHVAHVGDSRAYLVYDQRLRQITVDHSQVQQLVDIGRLTPEQARTHPQKHVLSRCMGNEPDVQVDTVQIPLEPGMRLMLCSDGLTDMLTEPIISQIIDSASCAQQACDRLVEAANRAGGQDNISIILVEPVNLS